MKNTLKRILLLLPVISVLLVFLAVPVFADATDGGYIEPVTFEECQYLYRSTDGSIVYGNVDVTLGDSFSVEGGGVYDTSYLLVIDYASLSGVSFDITLESPIALHVKRNFNNQLIESNSLVTRFVCDGVDLTYYYYQPQGGLNLGTIDIDSILELSILCTEDFLPYLTDVDYTYYTLESSSVDGFTSVWTEIMTWITSALNSVMGAFYVDGSLTLLGTLAVIGVSVGIAFLIIGLIQRFLHLRG